MKLKSLSQKDRYGNMFSVEFFEPEAAIPMMMMIPNMADGYNGGDTDNHPGDPKGTDTVPAWLTPGENVVNAEASRIPGNQEMIDEMNDEGRAIQEAQGGPIPTYASSGKKAQKIEKRKMKNGKIGLYRGNTFLGMAQESPGFLSKISDTVKETDWNPFNSEGGSVPAYAAGGMQIPRPDGMLNSLGNRLKEKNGGPMYAQGGKYIMPDFLSDEFLDNEIIPGMYATETSSGANVRTSEDGAIGPMQILPSTAASPGYGVAPRTLSEIRSLKGSQQFAKDYLRGIHKENPDFTMDEVVTAYHSGAGNVRKAKNNVEPLGARGQAYAGKVGVTEPSLTDKIASVISSLNPISEAQAQTVPPVSATPPVGVTNKEQGEGMLFNAAVPEYMRNNKMLGKKDYGDVTYDSGGAPQAVNPNRISPEKRQQIIDTFVKNNNQQMYDNQMAEFEQAVKQDKAHKEYLADQTLDESKQEQIKIETELSKINKQIAAADDDQLIAALKEKKDKILNKAAPPKVTAAPPKAASTKSIVQQIIGELEADPNQKTPPPDTPIPPEEKLDKTMLEKAKGYFSEMFSDLFSGPELARMAVMYAGSRALGYEHGGSLEFSMKQYVKRVDADIAARENFITSKEAIEQYTASSLQKYRETGDMNLLEDKTTGLTTRGIGDDIMHKTFGILPTVKIGKDTYGVVYNGTTYTMDDPIMKGKLSKVDPKLDDPVEIEGEFITRLKEKITNVKNKNEFSEDQLARFSNEVDSVDLAIQSSDLYAKDILLFGKDKYAKRKIRQEAIAAQEDFLDAMARHIKSPDKNPKPSSVDEYYHKRIVRLKTNNAVPYEMIRTANAQAYNALDKDIKEAVFSQGGSPELKSKMYFQMWNRFAKVWKAKSKGSKFKGLMASSNKENIGHNDFTNWVAHIIDKDRQEGNVAEQNTDGKSTHLLAMDLLKKE